MELRRYDAADAGSVAAARAVIEAANRIDAPWELPLTLHRHTQDTRFGWDGEVPRRFLAVSDTDVVGEVCLEASSWDNLEQAWVDLVVDPGFRRRGHGSAMLAQIWDVCREMGRPLFGSETWDGTAGVDFAARHGLDTKSVEVCRRMHLAGVPSETIDRLYDGALAAAADYELERVVGLTPREMLPALAATVAAISDAPTDGLEWERESFPLERVRRYEETQLAAGYRLYRLVARHRASGELAGHTVVVVDAEVPAHGDQHDTAVVREHRGHRLGLLLKAAMVRWLREVEPQLETIETWNAESNGPMIAVNDALGYRVLGRRLQFQRRL